MSTVVLWRRASLPGCSLFHPFASEITDYRDVPYQRQILLLRMGTFLAFVLLKFLFFLAFSLQDYQYLRGSSIDRPQASFEVRDSRATSSPPGSRALAGQAWVVESYCMCPSFSFLLSFSVCFFFCDKCFSKMSSFVVL